MNLGEIPVIGVVFVVIGVVIGVTVLAIFLPFVALGLLEAVLLAVIVTALALLATLAGRPIIVRAECDSPPRMHVWGIKGWAASRRLRDQVADALRKGTDPRLAAGPDAIVVAHHDKPVTPEAAE